jgi:hypothetical protein
MSSAGLTDWYTGSYAPSVPVVLSAPHGGAQTPADIPERTEGCVCEDAGSLELARAIRAEFGRRLGAVPHLVASQLHRTKLDANRVTAPHHLLLCPLPKLLWAKLDRVMIAPGALMKPARQLDHDVSATRCGTPRRAAIRILSGGRIAHGRCRLECSPMEHVALAHCSQQQALAVRPTTRPSSLYKPKLHCLSSTPISPARLLDFGRLGSRSLACRESFWDRPRPRRSRMAHRRRQMMHPMERWQTAAA